MREVGDRGAKNTQIDLAAWWDKARVCTLKMKYARRHSRDPGGLLEYGEHDAGLKIHEETWTAGEQTKGDLAGTRGGLLDHGEGLGSKGMPGKATGRSAMGEIADGVDRFTENDACELVGKTVE